MRTFSRALACVLSAIFLIVLSACGSAATNLSDPVSISASSVARSETTTGAASTNSHESKDAASDDYQFAVNKDNTVTITKYTGKGGDVNIPAEIDGKKVTAIGNTFEETGAFQDCSTLTSVIIPDGVTEIQDNAFYSCSSLATVTIPASVTLLRNCSFADCTKLKSLYFEGNAPQIANYVFDAPALTFYYHEGATGWANPYYSHPTKTY